MLSQLVPKNSILHLEITACENLPLVELPSIDELARFISKTENYIVFTGGPTFVRAHERKNRFMVIHEGVIYWAPSSEYLTFSDYDEGMKKHFNNGKDFYAAMEGGFKSFKEFETARDMGYKTRSDVQRAESKGFSGCFWRFIDLEFKEFSFEEFDAESREEGEIEWIGGKP